MILANGKAKKEGENPLVGILAPRGEARRPGAALATVRMTEPGTAVVPAAPSAAPVAGAGGRRGPSSAKRPAMTYMAEAATYERIREAAFREKMNHQQIIDEAIQAWLAAKRY